MYMSMIAGLVGLSVTIVLGLAMGALFRRRARMSKGQPALSVSDPCEVYTKGAPMAMREDLIGAFMLVAIGTFGVNQVQRLLNLLHLCHLERLVGSVLVIENDAQLREQFRHRVPVVYQDRIVLGYSEAYAGGMANRSPAAVMQHVRIWGQPIVKAAVEAADRQRRGVPGRPGRAPGNIFAFVSLGGQAAVGLPAMHVLHEQFAEVMTLGFTALPDHKRLRDHYGLLKEAYEQRGVHGWVLADNLGPDPTTADYGMIATVVALADAALHADQATQPNNTFSLALGEERGGVLVYQLVADHIVAHPHPVGSPAAPGYYVSKRLVVEAMIKGLERIEAGQGLWSAELPVGAAGVSTFDIVMAAVNHDDLLDIRDEVAASMEMNPAGYSGPPNGAHQGTAPKRRANYGRSFASIVTVADPQKPLCPVVVLRLAAVQREAELMSEIVKIPGERLLTPHSQVSLTILPTE